MNNESVGWLSSLTRGIYAPPPSLTPKYIVEETIDDDDTNKFERFFFFHFGNRTSFSLRMSNASLSSYLSLSLLFLLPFVLSFRLNKTDGEGGSRQDLCCRSLEIGAVDRDSARLGHHFSYTLPVVKNVSFHHSSSSS